MDSFHIGENARVSLVSRNVSKKMRQELEKYECFRRGNQWIDDIFDTIEKVLDNYEKKKHTLTRSGDVEDRKKKN